MNLPAKSASGVLVLLLGGCGTSPAETCKEIRIGTSINSISDARLVNKAFSMCQAHPCGYSEGPVEDLRKSEEVQQYRIGELEEKEAGEPSWCCVYVSQGSVAGTCVAYD
ncbi:MAG TPA: hypothetical protein VEY30_12360 [Myxococcaceae bacterium]|nr:hypothetical protein [Myxococcaceae bacterium]